MFLGENLFMLATLDAKRVKKDTLHLKELCHEIQPN